MASPHQAAPDHEIGLDDMPDVERGKLRERHRRLDPQQSLDVVLEGAADARLVPSVAPGPDPVIGDQVADAKCEPDGHQVRDEVVDAAEIGQTEHDRNADDQRGRVDQR